MFGPSHYVPILRWKHAERFALHHLQEEGRKRITPLIELTPAVFRTRKTAQRASNWRNTTDVIYQESKKLLEASPNLWLRRRRFRSGWARPAGEPVQPQSILVVARLGHAFRHQDPKLQNEPKPRTQMQIGTGTRLSFIHLPKFVQEIRPR